MNDHSDRRREPQWPADSEPDPRSEQPVESTGFWSPLWEEDDEPQPGQAAPLAPPPNGAGPNGAGRPGGPGPFPGVHRSPNGGPPRVPGPDATMAMNSPINPPGDRTVAVPQPGFNRGLPPGRPPGQPPFDPGRDPANAPTVMLPPPIVPPRAEPALLTHREPDDEDVYYDDEPVEDRAERPQLTDEEQKALRRKKIWRRVRRTAYVGTALMIIIPVLAFFITYQMVDVDSPQDVANAQDKAVTFYYADGSEAAKQAKSGANRIMLEHKQIPQDVLNAVFAAEDATFMSNSGFDLIGILRAGWNQVTGGSGGGSTISQQYVKKASGDEDKTLTRKWTEMVKSYKMNETYTKEEIITAYLNTIYFGRGAYGIAAAAKAYYNIDVQNLSTISKSQAALLAGMIQTPSRHKDTAYQMKRWDYVTGRMIANNWMTQAEKDAQPFVPPVPVEETKGLGLSAALTGLPDLVYEELRNVGLTEDTIRRNGYKIVLTIDKSAQDLAEKAVADVMAGQPGNLHPGLVAVDPASGQIRAYYPSSDGVGTDYAAARQEPGSSFKPFDLVGLLKKGKGIYETYDSTPKAFPPGSNHIVKNASKPSCGTCTVAQAMKESLNVVFSDMVYTDVKPGMVAEAAREAGVLSPLDSAAGDINIAIGGGNTQVTTTDMASAYATFAADGKYRVPHFVSKVTRPDGGIVFEDTTYQEKLAFDQNEDTNRKIARNVTETLLPVPSYSHIECAGGRLCAGKTGTHQYQNTQYNAKAWMVGYTRQLSTAVSLSGDTNEARLIDKNGKSIYGSSVPGQIWKKFMDAYHAKNFAKDKKDFGKFEPIGKVREPEPEVSDTDNAPVATTTPPTESSAAPPSDSADPKPTRPTKPSDVTTTPVKPTKPTRPSQEPIIPGLPGYGN